MPKTSRSEQMDFKGLEIIADEFTGDVAVEAISPGTATTVQGILEELAARITALENA